MAMWNSNDRLTMSGVERPAHQSPTQVFQHQLPVPDANKRYVMIMEENAKAQMKVFSRQDNASAQRMGRLYGAGMDHQLVHCGMTRGGGATATATTNRELLLDGSDSGSVRRNEEAEINTTSGMIAMGPLPPRREHGGEGAGLMSKTASFVHSTTDKHQYPNPVQSHHRFSVHESPDGGGSWHSRYSSRDFVRGDVAVNPLKSSVALGLLDHQPGGKFYVSEHVTEPYAEALVGKPQQSLFTKSTPLMWDLKKQEGGGVSSCTKSRLFQDSVAASSVSSSYCVGRPVVESPSQQQVLPSSFLPGDLGGQNYNSHALSASQGRGTARHLHHMNEDQTGLKELSALQQTLVDCGKLKRVDEQHIDQMSQHIYRTLQSDIKQTKRHAQWLKHKQGIGPDRSFFEDEVGSFFSPHLDSLDSYEGRDRSRESLRSKTIRQRALAGKKKLRQLAATHSAQSSASGDLTKYKKLATAGKTPGFRGNSSVMKIKGSQLEDLSESRVSQASSGLHHQVPSRSSRHKSASTSDWKATSLSPSNHEAVKATNYSDDLAEHLNVTLVSNTTNPHREQFRGDSDIKYASHQSLKALQNKQIDPKVYPKSSISTSYGSYNVSVKEPIIKDLPSKEYISKAMAQISKKMLISYDMRIVETGAALRALQDSRHVSPGIAAILELNRAFIAAASFNPSSWEVSRAQFQHVLNEQIPWFEKAAVTRLASAYDPHNSGVIKFARLTAALTAANRPALSILMTKISRDPDKVDESGNVFLLRLLHSLYEDCDGGVVEEIVSTLERDTEKCMQMAKANSKTALGIKLEDIPEILSVCASSVEEEALLQDLAQDVVQVLYEYGKRHDENFADVEEKFRSLRSSRSSSDSRTADRRAGAQELETENSSQSKSTLSQLLADKDMETVDHLKSNDRLFAPKILKFSKLKSISGISRVSQNAFIKCVARHSMVMTEFGRQVKRFRELITPYQIGGSMSYEESMSQNSSYGSIFK